MRKWLFLILLVLSAGAFAAPPDGHQIAELLREKGLKVGSIKLHMVQERFSPDGRKVRMEGIIWIMRPDRFRMDVLPPYESITILKGDQMLIYFPQEKVAQRVNVTKDPTLLRWVQFLREPWQVVQERTKVVKEEGKEIVLEIDTRDFPELDGVILWIDPELGFPVKIELEERGGDRAVITYSGVELGAQFPDDLFDLKLPPDVEITEF